MLLREVVEYIKKASSITFVIGAGASRSAGIPLARDLVKTINNDFDHCLSRLNEEERKDYRKVMGALSRADRKNLIQPLLDKSVPNWGHLALAGVIRAVNVKRVLSFNFDFLLEQAAAFHGYHLPVYDFGVSPTKDIGGLAEPALFHLHGQSYGLQILNTEQETNRHAKAIEPLISDCVRNSLTIVIGYSGESDAAFRLMERNFNSNQNLFWLGFSKEPAPHLLRLLKSDYAFYIGECDFDRTMIAVAREIGCFPPSVLKNPPLHTLSLINNLPAFPVMQNDDHEQLLSKTRVRLQLASDNWKDDTSQDERSVLAFMAGQKLPELGNAVTTTELEKRMHAWQLVELGDAASRHAISISDSDRNIKFEEAYARYAQALAVKPDLHEAFNNWGNSLAAEAAGLLSGARAAKLKLAIEKYRAALRIKPDYHEALYNWGNALSDEAKGLAGAARMKKLREAGERYASALCFKPDKHEALNNWGNVLFDESIELTGEHRVAKLREAGEKYSQAISIKPDKYETENNLGNVLYGQALEFEGEAQAEYLRLASEKYGSALKLNPRFLAALKNWGNVLVQEAHTLSGKAREKKFREAYEKYAAALGLKPHDHKTLMNWGLALSAEGERLTGQVRKRKLRKACELYAAAVVIKPNDAEALANWGSTLLHEASQIDAEARSSTIGEAKAKLLKAKELSGRPDFNLVCVFAIEGQADLALDELEACERAGTLPDREHLATDADMDGLRKHPRFEALMERIGGGGAVA